MTIAHTKVAAEDYDEAKRLKDRIVTLRGAGVQIAELERRKQVGATTGLTRVTWLGWPRDWMVT